MMVGSATIFLRSQRCWRRLLRVTFLCLLACSDQSFAFHTNNLHHCFGKFDGCSKKALKASNDGACPEIALIPRPGNELAIVACG
eukprot:scaffold2047_cov129-Cylindrotheca_fusiformis.AAC.6